MKNKSCSRLRRRCSGAMATVLLVITLAVLVALNILMTTLQDKFALRADLSFNSFSTYGEVTGQVLAELETPVHIWALYTRGQEDQPLLELLNRYAAASPWVTWEQADISLNPGLLSRFGTDASQTLTNDSLIVYCEQTDRFRILDALDFVNLSYNEAAGTYEYTGQTYESSLTAAIRYVSQPVVPRVMVLQGHGELDESATQLFASLLDNNSYEVYYFTLNHAGANLQPGDLLVMFSPVRDLTNAELEQIMTFVNGGGSILFTCDYTDPVQQMPNYMSLLRSYGFLPQAGVVVASADEPATYYNNNRVMVIPSMQITDITLDLVSGMDTFLVMPASRGFAMPTEADRYLTTEAVLITTVNAYARHYGSGSLSLSRQAEDAGGPFALALQAARVTQSGDISRAFILGASGLLTSQDEYAMTVSQQFIIRAAEWLLGQHGVDLSIMARAAVRPGLSMASAAAGSLIVVLLPALVLTAALLVLMWRRHK